MVFSSKESNRGGGESERIEERKTRVCSALMVLLFADDDHEDGNDFTWGSSSCSYILFFWEGKLKISLEKSSNTKKVNSEKANILANVFKRKFFFIRK